MVRVVETGKRENLWRAILSCFAASVYNLTAQIEAVHDKY